MTSLLRSRCLHSCFTACSTLILSLRPVPLSFSFCGVLHSHSLPAACSTLILSLRPAPLSFSPCGLLHSHSLLAACSTLILSLWPDPLSFSPCGFSDSWNAHPPIRFRSHVQEPFGGDANDIDIASRILKYRALSLLLPSPFPLSAPWLVPFIFLILSFSVPLTAMHAPSPTGSH